MYVIGGTDYLWQFTDTGPRVLRESSIAKIYCFTAEWKIWKIAADLSLCPLHVRGSDPSTPAQQWLFGIS
jgi:hypothetical protein